MTKEQVEQKIKEILAKDKVLSKVKVDIKFKIKMGR